MKPVNLRPTKETLVTQGKIFYRESLRAWNTLRLNKTLIHEFPMLRERREKFGYEIVLYRSFKELEKSVRKMEKEGEAIPMLLFLQKRSSNVSY
jgi:hypothetical protein